MQLPFKIPPHINVKRTADLGNNRLIIYFFTLPCVISSGIFRNKRMDRRFLFVEARGWGDGKIKMNYKAMSIKQVIKFSNILFNNKIFISKSYSYESQTVPVNYSLASKHSM